MSDEPALNEAAQALGRARWAGTTKRKRSQHMRWLAAQRKNPQLFRRSDAERCPCGRNTLHRAQLRAFDCCKKAGLMERLPQLGRPHKETP